jgi:hypothetical protein
MILPDWMAWIFANAKEVVYVGVTLVGLATALVGWLLWKKVKGCSKLP